MYCLDTRRINNTRRNPNKINKTKPVVCYKCGKIEYYSENCKVKRENFRTKSKWWSQNSVGKTKLGSDISSKKEDHIWSSRKIIKWIKIWSFWCFDDLDPSVCQLKSTNMTSSSEKGLVIKTIDNIQDSEIQRVCVIQLSDIVTQDRK